MLPDGWEVDGYFYPRPPRGGRPGCSRGSGRVHKISIHALREEGDVTTLNYPKIIRKFLSTPSARRATIPVRRTVWLLNDFYPRPPRGGRLSEEEQKQADEKISIHALREEGDQPSGYGRVEPSEFLSTPSARRATRSKGRSRRQNGISIHALREEGDLVAFFNRGRQSNFYPRPPRGGRQQKQRQNLYFLINYTTFCTNLEEP